MTFENEPSGTPPRRPHPLENRPQPPEGPPRQQVTLHIPSVRPNMTYMLITLNVAIFVMRALSPDLDEQAFLWGANRSPHLFVTGEYYRLFTSMFLHASIYGFMGQIQLPNALHLVFNMYILYAVGSSLERLFGHTRFLIVYLLGGLAGSIFSALSAVIGGTTLFSVGASGAVFAILGAEFVFLYHHRKLMGETGRARRQSLITFGIINLLFGLASTLPGSSMRVDNWAHLGGLVGGLILAWFISPILTLKAHPELPGEILGQDTNPLNQRYWVISVYGTILVVLVFIGTLLTRG